MGNSLFPWRHSHGCPRADPNVRKYFELGLGKKEIRKTVTRLFARPRGHTQIELGGEVDEKGGEAEGLRVPECRVKPCNCDTGPWLVSWLAAALGWPAGVGETQAGAEWGRAGGQPEQTILFPQKPSCHLPGAGALVSRIAP